MAEGSGKKPFFSNPDIILERLEERIVLDAAVDPSAEQQQQEEAANQADQAKTDAGSAGPNPASMTDAAAPPDDSFQTSLDQVYDQDVNVVLISDALGDIDAFTQAIGDEAEVIEFDAGSDSLDDIVAMLGDVLADGEDLDNVAILGHGDEGLLFLGTDAITPSNLGEFESSFQQLGELLAEDAQIQLFACSIAGTAEGQDMLDSIAFITSADVYASTDDTGPGGDWDLEYRSVAAASMYELIGPEAASAINVPLEVTPDPVNQGMPDVDRFEDAANTEIDLTKYFDNIGPNPTVTILNQDGDNPNLLTATIDNGVLTLDYTQYEFGTAHLLVDPGSGDAAVFTVTVRPVQDAEAQAVSYDFGVVGVGDPIVFNLVGYDEDPHNLVYTDGTGDNDVQILDGSGQLRDDIKFFIYLGDSPDWQSDTGNWFELAVGDSVTLDHGILTVLGPIVETSTHQYEMEVQFVVTDPDWTEGSVEDFQYIFQTTGNQWLGFSDENWVHDVPAWSIDIGDINQDGALDIVSGTVVGWDYYYLNDGFGNFTTFNIAGTDGTTTTTVALADFNADGALDLFLGRWYGNDVVLMNQGLDSNDVWLGFGAGIVLPDTLNPGSNAERFTYSVAVGDVDGDGYTDLITGAGNDATTPDTTIDNGIIIYFGAQELNQTSDWKFQRIEQNFNEYTWQSGAYSGVAYGDGYTTAIGVGDVDADGDLDIYVGKKFTGPGGDYIFINEGPAAAQPGDRLGFTEYTGFNRAGADGFSGPDWAHPYLRWTDDVGMVDIDGSLAGTPYDSTFQGHWNGVNNATWTPSDVNDITSDVFSANMQLLWYGSPNYFLLSEGEITGDGEGMVPYLITDEGYLQMYNSGQTTGIDWGDFDRDGIFDVATAEWCGPSFFFLGAINEGQVQFVDTGKFQLYDGARFARDVVVADLNGDGLLDIVLSNAECDYSGIQYYLNLGFGKTAAIAEVTMTGEASGDDDDDTPGDDDDDQFDPPIPELEPMISSYGAEGVEPYIPLMGSEFDADFVPRPLLPIPGFLFVPPESGVDLMIGPYGPGPGFPPPEWAADIWEVPEFTDRGAALRPDKPDMLAMEYLSEPEFFVDVSEENSMVLASILETDRITLETPESPFMVCYAAAGACFMGGLPDAVPGSSLDIGPILGKEIRAALDPDEIRDLEQVLLAGDEESVQVADEQAAQAVENGSEGVFDIGRVSFLELGENEEPEA